MSNRRWMQFRTVGPSLSPFGSPWAVTVVSLLAAALASRAAADPTPRFVPVGQVVHASADWVSLDGDRIAFGAAGRILLARRDPGLVIESEITLDSEIENAVLVGGKLYMSERDGGLSVLDTTSPATGTRAVDLNLKPRTSLLLARMDDYLLALEQGKGLHVLALPMGHKHMPGMSHQHLHGESRPVSFVELQGVFGAVAAAGRYVFITLEGEGLAIVDARDPEHPVLADRVPLDLEGTAGLAVNGRNLFALGPSGLRIAKLSGSEPPRVTERYPEVNGTSLEVSGRSLYVAGGERGLVGLHDTAAPQALHMVTVSDFSFTPPSLSIAVGDTVQWDNVAGFHNVRSCTTMEPGCSANATESFYSGPVDIAPWSFSHTFASAGSNPYTCQLHAGFMAGSVTVIAAPPGVPDGAPGTPLRVGKLNATGSRLSISWDTETCTGDTNYQIIYGGGSQLPTTFAGVYNLSGRRCNVGTVSPFTWNFVPDPSGDPKAYIWFLMLATDGATREGSWGQNSGAVERTGPGAGGSSGECGVTSKDLTNTCGQ